MKKIKLSRVLPWLALILALTVSVGVFAVYGMHNLDSDMSSEMVLAQLLNEEGGFITENWYYSTELRVVSPVPVYQLGLLLFDSWHMARTFSIAVLLCGVAASLIYALRGAGVKEAAVFAAAAIVLPISEVYIFVFTYGGFYTVYFMAACWMLGLVLRLSGRKRPWISLLGLLMLGVWSGLSGVRMIMISGLPMLMACAIPAFCALCRADKLTALRGQKETSFFLGALVVMIGMGAGYLVNAHVLSEICHFTEYGEEMVWKFQMGKVFGQVDAWTEFFGFRNNVPLLSLNGIAVVSTIAAALGMLIAPILLLCDKSLTPEERLVPLFTLCSLGLGVLLNVLTGRHTSPYHVAYYIAGVLFGVASMFMLLGRLRVRMPMIRTVLMACLVLMFTLEARCFLGSKYHVDEQSYEEAADYLVENGYTEGYASFWFANLLTEASDGALDVYCYNSFEEPELGMWLQKTAHHDRLPEGRVFVYVDNADFVGRVPCALDDHYLFGTSNGAIYGYDSAEEVQALQRAQ